MVFITYLLLQRQAFLSEVLNGMQLNVAQEIAKFLNILNSDAVTILQDDIEEQEAALDQLDEYCDDIDNAMG